uniref:ATP-grasp domain-containing protein n=1 Tax=Saccharopolyspora rectivirgula TaxID=28042 RepID=UPI0024094B04
LADELGVAGNDQSAVRTIRAKDLCRRKLRESGFAQPHCRVVRNRTEAEALMADTGPGPWIVKPRSGMGSTGVSLVDSNATLPEAINRVAGEACFLIETYVPGREFSAEGVMLGGEPRVLALTAKSTGSGFVETGHRMPADLDEPTATRAQDQVERALCAVGLSHGIFHVEFWVDGDSIVLGEVHARPGGDFIHAMVEHVRPGLELYGLLIDDLLGNPAPSLPAPSRAAGVEYLVLAPGEVRSVEGWEQVARSPEVLAAELNVRPGDRITTVRGSADRHGFLVFGADTSSEVDKAANGAKEKLHIDII